MKYQVVPVTSLQQNSTLLWCPLTMHGAITDPGGDIDRLLDAVATNGVELKQILITHGHIDHIGFTAELVNKTGVPVIGPHIEDRFLLESLDQYAQLTQLNHSGTFEPDRWLQDGDKVQVGEQTLDVIHCPGHTPGHVVYANKDEHLAIVGDVLFKGSVGRTDFPRSDHQKLIDSIKNKLLPLGDDFEFISGHGPNSTFGYERKHNPFLI